MNVTSRVFAVMRDWRVGHVEGVEEVGVYAYFVIPEDVNSEPRVDASALTPFTSRIVTTSLGLLSIHVLTSTSHVSNNPAS